MDIYTININRGFELCAARRRPPASIAIPVCQAGCTIASDTIVDRAARYYKEERDIYPSPFFPGSLCSKTAFPMFCLARREARSSFQSGPNIGRPRQMAGPDRGEIRQIALSGLATSKWIKLRSAIDSSHVPFDLWRTISLFLCSNCACLVPRYFRFCYFCLVLYCDRRRERSKFFSLFFN